MPRFYFTAKLKTHSAGDVRRGEDCQWQSARKSSDAICDCNREVSGSRNVTPQYQGRTGRQDPRGFCKSI